MPSSLITKVAKAKKITIDRAEHLWDKAKEIALDKFDNGSDEYWGYVVGIFKKMTGYKPATNETLELEDFVRGKLLSEGVIKLEGFKTFFEASSC